MNGISGSWPNVSTMVTGGRDLDDRRAPVDGLRIEEDGMLVGGEELLRVAGQAPTTA